MNSGIIAKTGIPSRKHSRTTHCVRLLCVTVYVHLLRRLSACPACLLTPFCAEFAAERERWRWTTGWVSRTLSNDYTHTHTRVFIFKISADWHSDMNVVAIFSDFKSANLQLSNCCFQQACENYACLRISDLGEITFTQHFDYISSQNRICCFFKPVLTWFLNLKDVFVFENVTQRQLNWQSYFYWNLSATIYCVDTHVLATFWTSNSLRKVRTRNKKV